MELKDCTRRAVITYNRSVSFFVKTQVWEARKKMKDNFTLPSEKGKS